MSPLTMLSIRAYLFALVSLALALNFDSHQATAFEDDSNADKLLVQLLEKNAVALEPSIKRQIEGLRLAMHLNPNGRRRFLIPDTSVKGAESAKALQSFLQNTSSLESIKAEIQSSCDRYEQELAKIPKSTADSRRRIEIVQRIRGLRSLLPPEVNKKLAPEYKRESSPHFSLLNWPQRSYAHVTTANFEIFSQGGDKATAELASTCELAYKVWKIIFHDCWGTGDPGEFDRPRETPFRVVLFRDKKSYTTTLQSIEKNISVSKGYYSPTQNIAFFYWEGTDTQETVVHELTHQFFFEGMSSKPELNTDRDSGFWAIEAIALYMESISIQSVGGARVVEIGGWDSKRLQAGRYRRLHDQFWVPWDEFRSANGTAFRTRKDLETLKAWYSQACGLGHYWMDTSVENQNAFLGYLKAVYAGSESASSDALVSDDDALREQYDKYLQESSNMEVQLNLARPYFENRLDAVLSRCPIRTKQLRAWPLEYRKSNWLDLSFTEIGDDLFPQEDAHPWRVVRLNLESTKISDRTLVSVAEMEGLTELDLSHCAVTDEGVELIKDHKNLRMLWLTGTQITDKSLPVFESHLRLEKLDVGETKFSKQAWDRLTKKKPGIKK